ncbi:MAG: hypothetical protein R8G01_10475 [Ilumatobacteraceae bacterium]|nr:hypothetical protein [Ilumatobacteraceae bacterium]
MEPGPVPPHERTWRHPSEVAAQERALLVAEPSPRGARFLALTTGALGLIAVGALMIAITPKPSDSPIALIASTTPSAAAQGIGRSVSAASLEPVATDRVGLRAEPDGVLATPIGDGRFALVTRASLAGTERTIIDVRLPSGRTSAGSIVTASGDTVVVALMNAEPGHAIASDRPSGRELVTVMATPPITVEFDDVDTLAVEEGTPVVDRDGHLVGICSRQRNSERVWLIEVSEALDDATSVVP